MRDLGSIPTWGNFLSLEFFCFHVVKIKMPILAFLCVCEKLDCNVLFKWSLQNTTDFFYYIGFVYITSSSLAFFQFVSFTSTCEEIQSVKSENENQDL